MIHTRHDRRKNSDGFTLIEVLLAVLIFAIVLGAINSVFYAALRLRNKTSEMLDKSLPLEQALVIIKRDLANIVAGNGALSGQLQSVPNGTNVMVGASGPIFYTSSAVIDPILPFGEVQKVSYALLPSTNLYQGRDLARLVSRNILSTAGEPPIEQRLVEGVDAINFSYYDGSIWRETWDSTVEETKLPRAIKMQLQLSPDRANGMTAVKAPVEIVVPIMAQASTNTSTTQASAGQ